VSIVVFLAVSIAADAATSKGQECVYAYTYTHIAFQRPPVPGTSAPGVWRRHTQSVLTAAYEIPFKSTLQNDGRNGDFFPLACPKGTCQKLPRCGRFDLAACGPIPVQRACRRWRNAGFRIRASSRSHARRMTPILKSPSTFVGWIF